MKSWLEKNDVEMYLTHNERKSVIVEKFIRTLKIKSANIGIQYQKMCILVNWVTLLKNITIHIIELLK